MRWLGSQIVGGAVAGFVGLVGGAIILWFGRESFKGTTTLMYLTGAFVFFMLDLTFLVTVIERPLECMRTLEPKLDEAAVELERMAGSEVIRRAAGVDSDAVSVTINLSKYQMDEESLGAVQGLVGCLDYIEQLRARKHLAKKTRVKLVVFSTVYWPLVVLIAFGVATLEQSVATGAWSVFGWFYIVGLSWLALVAPRIVDLRSWRDDVERIHDMNPKDVRREIVIAAMQDEE